MKKVKALHLPLNRRRFIWMMIGIIVALLAAQALHSRSVADRTARRAMLPRVLPSVQTHTLQGGSSITVFVPHAAQRTIVIAVPVHNELDNRRLRKLSFDASATLIKIELSSADCLQTLQTFDESLRQFAPAPDVVVGLDQEAMLARRWLSLAQNAQATAVSLVIDSIAASSKQACTEPNAPLPSKGTWHNLNSNKLTFWNNGVPTDITSPLTAKSAVAEDLDTYLRHDVLKLPQLNVLEKLPLIEMPATPHSDTLAIFYSGDGGWRGLDKTISEHLSKAGLSVVGVDTLEYYWDFRSPEKSASELSELMAHYRQTWGIKHFIIAGYSFGADVLPALYNRLPATDQVDIDSIVLLSFARCANFEIRIEGMMGRDTGKFMTAPEVALLPPKKVLCVYGTEESRKTGCPDNAGKTLALPGNHHFNDDYETLSAHLIEFIKRPPAQQGDDLTRSSL